MLTAQDLWFVDSGLVALLLSYVRWATDAIQGFDATAFERAVVSAATSVGLVASNAAIDEHYRRAEEDSYRPVGCAGNPDGKRQHKQYRQVSADLDERLLADVPAPEDPPDTDEIVPGESARVSVAAVADALRAADSADRRADFARTFEAIGQVEWNETTNQPNMVRLAQILGVSRPTAQERYKRLVVLLKSGKLGDSLTV